MRRRLLAGVVALLAPASALAHPHVLIDSHAVVVFENGKVAGLQMGWKFDQVTAGSLVMDYDADKNGKLSAKEISTLEKEAFQDTAQYAYFTPARVDGKPVAWPKATGFQLLMFKDTLVYSFRLSLPEPVDPRAHALSFSTFEETYYIDIDFPDAEAVKLTGTGAEGCSARISPDLENRLLGGVVTPKKVEIACAP